MIEKIAKYVLTYPKTVISCCIIITILLASGIGKIRIENDIKRNAANRFAG